MTDQPGDDAEQWLLDSDQKLLAAVQEFSAGFLTSLRQTQDALHQLLKDTRDVEVRTASAGNRLRLLAHTHFVEQVVTSVRPFDERAGPFNECLLAHLPCTGGNISAAAPRCRV